MGKHAASSDRNEKPAGTTTRKLALDTTSRKLLAAFLLLASVITLVALVAKWPDNTPVNTSEAFEQNSGLTSQLADGTVFSIQPGQCNSPSIGQVFTTAPINDPLVPQDCTHAIVNIESGPDEGKRTLLEVHSDVPGSPDLQQGERIVLAHHGAYSFQDYQRSLNLWIWLIVTAALICIVGMMRGVRSLLGLAITFAIVLLFLIPAIARGGDPVVLALITGATVLFAVLFLVHGLSWKTASAMGGTLIALGAAGLLSYAAVHTSGIRGLGEESNLHILLYLPGIDIRGLMLAGMIIGSLGVLNDVTIAQASTVNELHELEEHASRWHLMASAMKVGRDHIASMVYTLVLSYTGVALPTLLIMSISGRPFGQIITSDVVATELLRSVTGAIALTLAVPLTTFIAAFTVTND